MAIHVALNHVTHYTYDRPVALGPQVIRLRPAPHAKTPVPSYSLKVTPTEHFINWQQDPQGNFLARLVFPEPTAEFKVEVDLVAEIATYNPFDFFLEPHAETIPFAYTAQQEKELAPYLTADPAGPALQAVLDAIDRTETPTVDFLVGLNQMLQTRIGYVIRMEPGVQSPDETLTANTGSCRDTGWLLVQILRHLGLAARFVSGYLIQLKPDVKPLEGPSGATEDFTDLHAWAEVYLPGAGWVGMDPTSGLLTGEGHIPLAATPDPVSAAPIEGLVDPAEVGFGHAMSITRIAESPRVTKPYTDDQWAEIKALGGKVDADLAAGDVRLTMGGEPTFVAVDDPEGAEWNTEAMGPTKRGLSDELIRRLRRLYAPDGLLHYGQGKWYPGEPLPRWAFTLYWRTDGVALWRDAALLSAEGAHHGHDADTARRFAETLAGHLGLAPSFAQPAFEDPLAAAAEGRDVLAGGEDVSADESARIAKLVEAGLKTPSGYVLPLRPNPAAPRRQQQQQQQQAAAAPDGRWLSEKWRFQRRHLFLIPGASPVGFRLPLDKLPRLDPDAYPYHVPLDPFAPRGQLPPAPDRAQRSVAVGRTAPGGPTPAEAMVGQTADPVGAADAPVRTALCVEPRAGCLHVFLPPLAEAADAVALLGALEETARALQTPIVIEGYAPPKDPRFKSMSVTPDPGVIEVNIQPAFDWDELVRNTEVLYEEAFQTRLGTEKFLLDGRHVGTGGGNHVVVGGPTPEDSPFLRRPDLLGSMIRYWQNHPALSYLFSGLFIGPTSQAPRVDEARGDVLYELEIALAQIPAKDTPNVPPWLIDRILRHLLTDVGGNTHRAEFCIDKLYSPDSATGRLGLVELRGFEMPPHARMSLAQQLVIRALIAWFWRQPYARPPIRWATELHDRFMLPHFVAADMADVCADLTAAGYPMDPAWFAPHLEFRFPYYGRVVHGGVEIDVRGALEPWNVLGEEPAGGATVRFVDSSVERVQVKVAGFRPERHVLAANGRRVPLAPTGVRGEAVAGVRFRAWQPANCLHPTVPPQGPLVFDLIDTWTARSIGGCTYHVAHPGGRNFDSPPINAYEAESRRLSRFERIGHTPGPAGVPIEETNPDFPLTLDLRRSAPPPAPR